MTNVFVKAVEIFYSYAHEDESLQKELEKHLSSLRHRNLITTWHDRKIQAGEEWNVQIDKHLSTAQIILLLISPDFLASDYSYGVEVKRAMELHKRGEARVIPIILRPSEWKGEPYGELQVLPPDGVAVALWPNKDEAFRLVTEGIQKVVEEISLNTLQEDTALYKPFVMHEQLDPLILRVAWSSDNHYLASVGSEGIVRIWDGRTFTLIKKLHPGNKQVGWLYSLAWSPDAKLLIAAGYDREFRIWDVETGTVQNAYRQSASPILDMRWSRNIGIVAENGWSIVSCSSDAQQEQTVTSSLFIKEAPAQQLFSFRVQRAAWAWHADAFIASCEGGTVFLQRGNTQVHLASPLNGSQVRAFSWNVTDTEIAVGYSDGYIQVWNVDQFKKQYEWRTEQPDLQTLCWGKKGRIIISGDSVGKVKVWRVPEAQLIKIFDTQSWSKNQDNRVTALATSSDDSFLCSAYEKGRLNVWTM